MALIQNMAVAQVNKWLVSVLWLSKEEYFGN